MINTLLVGDIHLKGKLILPLLDNVIRDKNVQRVIFLGDYADLYGQSKNIKLYAEDLTFLYSWQKEMQDRGIEIVNLVGNHDIYYLLGTPAPFSIESREVFYSVRDLLFDMGLQIAFQLEDYLVSHAGYNFMFEPEPWHFEKITRKLLHEEELEILAHAIGPMRGGGDLAGSPVWADLREMQLAPNPNFPKQIVGHTPKKSIDISSDIIGVDTFSIYLDSYFRYQFIGNGDLLLLTNGELEVIPTNWAIPETLEKLPKPFTM